MREYKFRGLNRRNDRRWSGWHYGDLWHEKSGVCVGSYEVDPETVGQFTGLKDHKGREIYEGDIVKVVSYGEESFHVVKYMIDLDYPAFDLEPALDGDFNSLSYCLIDIDTKITVIGNIHDNPELLRLTKTGGFEK